MNPPNIDLDGALGQFGLVSFRPGQREVISSIVAGHDCMCVMPTGGGKSLCFQMPAIVRPGLTIVVSPLIALMKDQVDALGKKGIPAALINSTLSPAEQQQRLQDVASGKYKLVYVAPERLRNNRFLDAIRATPIQLLAIDEAHCISQWGHDFRPDYARLGKFREWLGNVQTIALTATATVRVRQDIVEVLRLKQPKQFMSGFARPNLHFGVVNRQTDREKDEELMSFLKREKGAGIIYASTRKRCESIVEMLQQSLKIPVGAYHAGLLLDQRRVIQDRFMKDELRIIVATNAFGMGIDKPDLRFVIHYNIPGSLEAYYQEAGRAGRDAGQSQCVLFYSYQDRYIQEFFIDSNYPPREVIERVYEFLQQQKDDPIEQTHQEIRDALGLSVSTEAIGSSLHIISRTEVIERLETSGGLAMLKIESDLPTLVDLLPKDATVKRRVLRAVERAVGQRRGEEVYVHPRWLMQETELDRDALNRHLRELAKLDQVDYIPPFRGRAVRFLKRGVPFNDLGIDFDNLNKRKDAEYERLNQVVRFAQSPRCRQATIMEYFGDTSAAECGQCDRCAGIAGWPPSLAKSEPMALATGVEEIERELQNDRRNQKESGVLGESARHPGLAPSAHYPGLAPSAHSLPAQVTPATVEPKTVMSSQQQTKLLTMVINAVERIHGRLGKILIAQYLCGSNNAKVQKLRLHRLPGFGMLQSLRQTDAVELLDAMLAAGLLAQQEVNRNRPTVSISPELQANRALIQSTVSRVILPPGLRSKLTPTAQAMTAALESPKPVGSLDSPVTATKKPNEQAPASAKVQSAASPQKPSEPIRSELRTPLAQPPRNEQILRNDPSTRPMTTPSKVSEPAVSAKSMTKSSSAPNSALGLAEIKTGSPPVRPQVENSSAKTGDWVWTLQLLEDGYSWSDVLAIRRKSDLELAADLQEALKGGRKIQRAWLNSPSAVEYDGPTPGQQRVLRELQRRAAAGVT